METLNEYGRLERLFEIKSDIENGSVFNGTVYGENKGKMVNMFVYLDGKKRYFKEVSKEDYEIVKIEATNFLAIYKSAKVKITWTVDGKSVENNLGYAEMYNRFGMDFE